MRLSESIKLCRRCSEVKDCREFYVDNSKKDKISTYCKQCTIEKSKLWANENKAKRSQIVTKWKNRNIEEYRNYHRGYRMANLNKMSEKEARRRCKKRGNGVFVITKNELNKLYSTPCYICQSSPSSHLDHIIPLAKGGRHSIGNLAGACASCNLQKGALFLSKFKYKRKQKML